MSLAHWFVVGQVLALLPAMPEGTEVRILSADLFTVYASARVQAGRLQFNEFPPVGTIVRVLIFPPDPSPEDRAAALSGATALQGRVTQTPDGPDILLTDAGDPEPVSLREVLQDERGIVLELPLGGDR